MRSLPGPAVRRFLPLLLLASTLGAAVPATDIEAARALYRQRGKSLEAQQAFEAIAAADPRNPAAQHHLGLLALRRDDTEAAIRHLEQAVSLQPDDGAHHKALGDAYGRSAQKASVFQQLGFAKKCLAAYQRAVALAPDRVEFRQSLFEYYRQAPGFAGGGVEKATAEAAAIKQRDATAGRLAFATLYVGQKKYAEAFAQFDEVLATKPDDPVALYQIGRLAALTGHEIERGLQALRRCLEFSGAPPAGVPSRAALLWRLGTLLEKKGDRPAAREAYTRAVETDAGFAPAAEALKKLEAESGKR